MSYRIRLFIYLTAMSVIVVLATLIIVNWRFQLFADYQVRSEIARAPAKFDEFQRTRMENLITLAANVATDARLRGSLATQDQATIHEAARQTFLDYKSDIFWVLGSDGEVLSTLGSMEADLTDPANTNMVRNALSGFVDGDIWTHGEHLYQVAASPILAGTKIVGVLIFGYQFEHWLTNEFSTLTGMHIAIVQPDGKFCSTYDLLKESYRSSRFIKLIEELERSEQQLPVVPVIDRADVQPSPPQIEFRQAEEPFTGAVFTMNNIGGEKLATAVVFRSTRVEEELLSRIQSALLIVVLGAVFVSFLAAYFLSRNLTNPIQRLVGSSRRLGSGELDKPIEFESKDEIGVLARAMEEMRLSLLKARSELIRGERLSTIGQMASGILHDFRQPITAIYGYMDLLAMPDIELSKREDYRDKVVVQVDNMLGMVNELLDFARGEVRLNTTKVRVIDFAREIVDSFEVQCKSRYITLESSVEWTGSIDIDRNRMRRVLENLLRNSIQSIQHNGRIEINVNKLSKEVRISVTDSGKGMPPEVVEHLFEPFYTHGKKEGTGLGMAVVKRVVEEHGGSIEVESQVEKGTTITIILPV